ncbi:hypothetical protein [Ponticoccus litoralis]|uniref:Uncharacterized protein n=1 Tax=Ponticoccus litoralis TaxID=422297 RepID=A0AAW9SEU2_9RHOB
MTTEISTRLANKAPAEVDQAILSQASQLGVALRAGYKTVFPKGGGSYDMVTGYDVGGSVTQAPAMLRSVQAASTPAETRSIEGWLAELSVLTIPRKGDEMSGEVTLVAYASRLGQYPADIARAALLDHPWKFWPSWVELQDVCDRLNAPRRHMAAALANPAAPEPDPVAPRATHEQTSAILAGAGYTPKRLDEVRRHRMASTDAEMQAADKAPAHHWSETVAPDSPEMEALRKSRDENPLVQEARRMQMAREERQKASA